MARGKKKTLEQIVSLLRQVEVAVASGKKTAQASKEAAITEQFQFRTLSNRDPRSVPAIKYPTILMIVRHLTIAKNDL
jgi:hypothetical protein